MRRSLLMMAAVMLAAHAHSGSLTQREINQIESEFGITLSSNQIAKLSAVVYPTNSVQWRTDAYARIDASRKANLDIQVVDMNGDPIEGAFVAVKMKSSAFRFGGTFSAKDFAGVTLPGTMTTDLYKERLISMFNAVGLNNGFKPRLTGIHPYLPDVKSWAATNGLPIRGHLLIWPGNEVNNHLTDAVLADVEAVEAALTNGSSQATIDALRDDLRATVRSEMEAWASSHDVYEWDVINEPLGNHRVQDALDDYDVMAEWFGIAQSNKVSSDCKLLINEYQIISAMSESRTPGLYTDRRDRYMTEINRLTNNLAPLHRIGFQSRIKHERRDPQLVYDRLEEWGNAYGLEMAGTEFEVVDSDPGDWKEYIYTEDERAQITEEMMTQYYSHPLVTGFNAWNTINDETEALVDYSGNPTLHGLVWYYLHRIRFSTDANLASSSGGHTGLRAFKGDYEITVSYNGQDYVSSLSLTNNESVVLQLGSSVADAANTSDTVDAWHYDGLTNGAGLSQGISTGIVGGISFPDYALATIQDEAVRWQSDGATDSMYRGRDLSSYDDADAGVFQLSVDYLDADFTATAALSNGLGRVQFAIRDTSGTDAGFRLIFTSGGGSDPKFRLEAADDLGSNQFLANFTGATLGHLGVRAVYDLDNRGSAGSFKVYYRFDGGAEVEAYSGQLPADFDLDLLRYVVQTYNGGANWAAGDHIAADNLVLRKFGDAPPPIFLVDPIDRPGATQDVAYTGQTIAGTATNAVAYSKLMGPAWLNIASDGSLSGTPGGSDVGQNSWIVQASNGIETDTAVLKINVGGTGSGIGSNISINQSQNQGWFVPSATSGTSSYAGISAQAGDVIVLTVSGNKKGSVVPLSAAQVGGTGTTGPQTVETNGLDTYPTSWAWYQTVTSSGTFDFDITTDNTLGITAISALYVVRAGSGTIQLADSASWDDTDNADNGTSYSLDYSFGSSLPDGVLIESVSSRTDLITKPAAYTEDRYADKRLLASYDGVTGSSWSSVYTLSGGVADKQTSGAVGLTFVEITSGGAPRPVFDSDPIIELYATQDEAYIGQTLADNVSGTVSPSFAKISGPAWLAVGSGGALSGTPAWTDIGTNNWKVLVTDGVATNFATLEIEVVSSAPPVASPNRTRLFPTNSYNVLFIAIDDMRPLIDAYGETDPLRPITPEMDRLAASGVMFGNAHCQQAVCNASRASLMTGLRPDTTMCWKLDTHFRTKVPDVITLPQHFGANGYRVHGIGKIYHSTNPTWQDDPLSWNEGWASSSTDYTWYEAAKAALEDAGTNSVSATDAGEVNTRDGSRPIVDADYNDGYAAEQGVAKIAEYAAGYSASNQPFFLAVGFQKPHMPFNAPKAYWDLYDPAQIDLTGYTGIRQMPVGSNKFTAPYGGEPSAFLDITGTSDNGMPNATEARHLIHGYLACVSFIDAQVGKLLDALEDPDGNPGTDDSIAENTIIVLWGDHGFHLGDHNGFWAKHSNYEISTRVPLIVRAPGMEATGSTGANCVGLVELVDIYPTLIDLCSLPAPSQPPGQALQGTTFLPLLEDPAQPWKKAVFSQYQRYINANEPGDVPVANAGAGMGYSVRTERYRYTEWWVTDSTDETDRHIIKADITEPGLVELYDYVADPGETTNLAANASYSGLVAELSALLNDSDGTSAGDGWALPGTDAPSGYPVDYNVWTTNHLAPGRTMVELGVDADPDGDGIANRIEYKFGTHPLEFDEWPVDFGLEGGSLYVTYPNVESRTDVLLEALSTSDLVGGAWSGLGVATTNVGQRGNAVIKTGSVPVSDPARFLKLEATGQ